jgi:predicted XRE-type DNA-binding protein
MTMRKISVHRSSGNVFRDMGFTAAEAAELSTKSMLIDAIADTIERRKLTQKRAAAVVGTDQPTLSKVLRGCMDSVTIDRLTAWLTALGRTVEIHVRPMTPAKRQDSLSRRSKRPWLCATNAGVS